MNEFNERTRLNHQLQADEAQTMYNRIQARKRQSERRAGRAYRKSVTIVAVSSVLAGAALTAGAATVASLICWVL